NILERFPQYNVKFHDRYFETLKRRVSKLPKQIAEAEQEMKPKSPGEKGYEKLRKEIKKKKEVLADTKRQLEEWAPEKFGKLSAFQKNLYKKAFTINDKDPDFMELSKLKYKENDKEREILIPKGDVLYQFRKDVDSGQLPTVSWLAPPKNFSDHPSAPWFG